MSEKTYETYYEGLCRMLRCMVGKTVVSKQTRTVVSDWTMLTTIGDAPAWLRGDEWMLPRHAADAIERLISERDELRDSVKRLSKDGDPPTAQEIVKSSNALGNGTHRVYMVSAQDFCRGTIMPIRIATAKTLAAMIERCAADIQGEKPEWKSTFDMTVMVKVGDLEVSSD